MKVKDGRKRGWWWARNEIFDQWGAILEPNGLVVYLCLCRHANDDAECWPSLKRIAQKCGMHRTTVIKNIKLLESHQLIHSESRLSDKGDPDTNIYTILSLPEPPSGGPNDDEKSPKKSTGSAQGVVVENDQGGSPEQPPVVAENDQGGSPEQPPVVAENDQGGSPERPKGNLLKETNLKETNLRKPPYSPPEGDTNVAEEKKETVRKTKKSKEDNHPARELIDYLNQVIGRQFKHVPAHFRHINARFQEGFTANELKLVVNFKTSQWISDPKMNQYLRPSTLFGTKADDYLQAALQAGGNPENPEAVIDTEVGATNAISTDNNVEKTKIKERHYGQNHQNYQPGRVPKTPWEKTQATIERVFGANTTLDQNGNIINEFNFDDDDYAF